MMSAICVLTGRLLVFISRRSIYWHARRDAEKGLSRGRGRDKGNLPRRVTVAVIVTRRRRRGKFDLRVMKPPARPR